MVSGVIDRLAGGLLPKESEGFSTNYPPTARFFSNWFRILGNSGILFANKHLNKDDF